MNDSGYSCCAQDYILSMLKSKPETDIKLHYLNSQIGLGVSRNRAQFFASLHAKKLNNEYLNIYHSIPARYRRPAGPKKHIGFCIYETIDPPKDWVQTMNNMDAIITASQFNKNVFETSGVKAPIEVIPHCFDVNMFNKKVQDNGRYGKTTFISMGTWKGRKNWEGLIRGWYTAFENRDNVCLLVKTNKPKEFKTMVMTIKQSSEWRAKSTAPIYAEENPICDFEDIPRFLRKGDIYISTSLGEGFGLVGMHAMAMGIPVITIRFGGSLEYAKPEYCTYLEPSGYVRISDMDAIPQLSNCIWPQIKVGEIASKLRYVFINIKEREQKAEKAYDYVHKNYSYEAIGPKFLDFLELNQ